MPTAAFLKPLDEFIQAENFDLTQYVDARVQAFNYGGSQYCLPKGLDAVYVALNTEIFAKYNVEPPKAGWTWDDMRATAGQARDAIARGGRNRISDRDGTGRSAFVFEFPRTERR